MPICCHVTSSLRRCLRGTWIVLALLLLATPVFAAETEVRLEYSPLTPASDIQSLQTLASDGWLSDLYQAFPESLRAKIQLVSVENLDHGVAFHLDVHGSDADRHQASAIALGRIRYLAEHAAVHADHTPIQYTYQLTGEGPQAPSIRSSTPLKMVLTVGVVLLVVALGAVMVIRRRLFLSLPSYYGLPVIGILPNGLGMGGRFLELQSQHCQALAVFFRRLATLFKPTFREAAIVGLDNLDASAAVTACLSVSLLRERGRVLVVDLAGDESNLPAILEETDDAGEFPMEGTLRSTSIADLDLLTGLVPVDARRPPLPSELLSRYRWVIYHAPKATPLEQMRHILVLTDGAGWREVLRGRTRAWWHKARLLGVALVGVDVPMTVRDTYMARFYFEKLRLQEVGAA